MLAMKLRIYLVLLVNPDYINIQIRTKNMDIFGAAFLNNQTTKLYYYLKTLIFDALSFPIGNMYLAVCVEFDSKTG